MPINIRSRNASRHNTQPNGCCRAHQRDAAHLAHLANHGHHRAGKADTGTLPVAHQVAHGRQYLHLLGGPH
ncbi:hypothetical protein, partial [Rhodoferax sp.]|uniref:hypothetical protein n=1 Tax=Rhodoferax sp. TaxID=50421 RepID=UPI003266D252